VSAGRGDAAPAQGRDWRTFTARRVGLRVRFAVSDLAASVVRLVRSVYSGVRGLTAALAVLAFAHATRVAGALRPRGSVDVVRASAGVRPFALPQAQATVGR
jgi:hypothetical protein